MNNIVINQPIKSHASANLHMLGKCLDKKDLVEMSLVAALCTKNAALQQRQWTSGLLKMTTKELNTTKWLQYHIALFDMDYFSA